MAKIKKKLTAAQKRARRAAKAERKKKYEWVFMHGKQVRIKRLPKIEGMDIDEFIEQNADSIWLHQNEMWGFINTDDVPHRISEEDELLSSYTEFAGFCSKDDRFKKP